MSDPNSYRVPLPQSKIVRLSAHAEVQNQKLYDLRKLDFLEKFDLSCTNDLDTLDLA